MRSRKLEVGSQKSEASRKSEDPPRLSYVTVCLKNGVEDTVRYTGKSGKNFA